MYQPINPKNPFATRNPIYIGTMDDAPDGLFVRKDGTNDVKMYLKCTTDEQPNTQDGMRFDQNVV